MCYSNRTKPKTIEVKEEEVAGSIEPTLITDYTLTWLKEIGEKEEFQVMEDVMLKSMESQHNLVTTQSYFHIWGLT